MKNRRKYILIGLIGLIFCLSLIGCSSNDSDNPFVEDGVPYWEKEDFEKSEDDKDYKDEPYSRSQLEDIYHELSKDYDELILREKTYEEVRNEYFHGEEGEFIPKVGNTHYYQWHANDDLDAYVEVLFDKAKDGSMKGSGLVSYFPE